MAERLVNRLKERRTELSLTQAELAEKVGVTRKTVNTVENGVFTPSGLPVLAGGRTSTGNRASRSGALLDAAAEAEVDAEGGAGDGRRCELEAALHSF